MIRGSDGKGWNNMKDEQREKGRKDLVKHDEELKQSRREECRMSGQLKGFEK